MPKSAILATRLDSLEVSRQFLAAMSLFHTITVVSVTISGLHTCMNMYVHVDVYVQPVVNSNVSHVALQ